MEKEYKKCFVAVLDILGFEERIKKIRDASRILYDLQQLKKLYGIMTDKGRHGVKGLIMSDTLLLYSEQDDFESFKLLIGVVAETICDGMGLSTTNIATPFTRMLFRGAISYGDFCIDETETLFFGPAFIDAYHWEKKQEWIGAILTPACVDFIRTKKFIVQNLLVEYDAPIKTTPIVDRECKSDIHSQVSLCVCWANCFAYRTHTNLKHITIEEKFKQKWEYTEKFFEYCRKKSMDDEKIKDK